MGITFKQMAIRGIDTSAWNGMINWQKAKDLGCQFCVIRAGFGVTVDYRFKESWANAKPILDRAAYWYMDYYSNYIASSSAYGVSDEEWGKRQARTCWNALKDDFSGMVFLDIENASASLAPPITNVRTRVLAVARGFLTEFDALSKTRTGLYLPVGNLGMFAQFNDRPLWVAWYNESQTLATVKNAVRSAGWLGEIILWQYTSDGDFDNDGVSDGRLIAADDEVDLNAWFDKEKYKEVFGHYPVIDVVIPDDETGGETPASTFAKYTVIAYPWLFVRASPALNGKIIGTQYRWSSVNVSSILSGDNSQKKGWAKRYGQDGYLSADYLEKNS